MMLAACIRALVERSAPYQPMERVMLLKITALALTAALGAVPAYAETPEIRGSIIVAANIMTPKKAEIELASGRFASSRDYLAALERIALASEAEERQFRR